jgi:hypothetical protein
VDVGVVMATVEALSVEITAEMEDAVAALAAAAKAPSDNLVRAHTMNAVRAGAEEVAARP